MYYSDRTTPRSLIFFIDVIIVIFAILIAYLLRFNFHIPPQELERLPYALLLILGVRIILFIISKSFAGIIRYTESQDIIRIFLITLIGSVALAVIDVIVLQFKDFYLIPRAVIIIEFIATTLALSTFRMVVKVTYWEIRGSNSDKQNIIIFGAGEGAIITKKALDQDLQTRFKVVAYIDDDPKKTGKKIENILIHSAADMKDLLDDFKVEQVIIAIQNLSTERKKEIAELCLAKNVNVLHVPPVKSWINGQLSINQIKKVRISDLLERDEIKLDQEKIRNDVGGKCVLVTGAAGSIGSEIARQVIKYNPTKVILFDIAETPIYHLELEFSHLIIQKTQVVFEIGDIRNEATIATLFETYKPDIVYHAAAYKHVPVMENNPKEAILTNILGTKTLAKQAIKSKVNKFVMISTDKAVNPTNVMGASKRIAEMVVQTMNQLNSTAFITTRFGNVLGSNGSVIKLFEKQIKEGGPLTITDPEVTRYFMTIPEACQLVLEAGAHGSGGEIYVFDMGKSVKIIDLAKKMIKLSGLDLGKDIQIVFTGLRPGEKLYEELLATEENNLPTHHRKILKANVRVLDYNKINKDTDSIISECQAISKLECVSMMKELVPEFKSQNSTFEQLDKN